MNKKGFIFTLDASIALLTMFVLLASIAFYIQTMDQGDLAEVELLEYSRSVASVMEIERAFDQGKIVDFLGNHTRNETCFNVSVYDVANVYSHGAVKTGCSAVNFPIQVHRSYMIDESYYLVKMEAWYE
jgi:hypothetical protein